MILGHDILSGLKIDLFFSYNEIRDNGSAYEGYTIPMKGASKMNFNVSSNWIKNEIFCDEELWISNMLWTPRDTHTRS